jgi:Domain of unknown function (DUF4352)
MPTEKLREPRFALLGMAASLLIIAVLATASCGTSTKDKDASGTRIPTVEEKATELPNNGDNEATLAVGESATAQGIRVTILQIVDPFTSANPISVPAGGTRFVAFKIRIENVSDKNHFFNRSNLRLRDAADAETAPAFGASPDKPSMEDAPDTIAPGANIEGWEAFELPIGVAFKDLIYVPDPFAGPDIHFRVPR